MAVTALAAVGRRAARTGLIVVAAVRGALGFLSRVPVGRSEGDWEAFVATPAAFPLAGYVLGALLALVVLVPLSPPSGALAFLLAVVALIGINHFDGVADLGDAAVVHGDRERRRQVMKDTDLGVGGALAVAVVVAGLALAGLALFDLPTAAAAGVVLAGEVGAKLAMAALACLGSPAHEGLGSRFADRHRSRDFLIPLAIAAPAGLATWPSPAAFASLLVALATGLAVRRWAQRRLGGVSGDVFGAVDHLARIAALHAGALAWAIASGPITGPF